MLKNKCIVVGVCGGIAAYKAVDIVSRLKSLHAEVHVIMTKSACEFVTPLTFRSISQNPCITGMFDKPEKFEIAHVALAQKADMILVAPATANMLGKIAYGLADDMLSATIMATKKPVYFAPAMNNNMYSNCIVQNNIKTLTENGYHFIDPETGRLACGTSGKGRLAAVGDIIDSVVGELCFTKDLAGLNIMVTAGPTREQIDPVRFISNYSTGKMGYAIARAAKHRGANVTLITGPTTLNQIKDIKTVFVDCALDMYDACMDNFEQQDIIIKSAAVGDFRPTENKPQKIKKGDQSDMSVNLTVNPDILTELANRVSNQTLVGFCMETENLVESAKQKLREKNLDMVVANSLVEEGAGFKEDTNVVTIIDREGRVEGLPLMKKDKVANAILDRALMINNKKRSAGLD